MSSIELHNVCLDYIIQNGTPSIKQTLAKFLQAPLKKEPSVHNSTFRALNNINLSIKKGDRVGLIGSNGAGKSSLLRVLAKIYQPNSGNIEVNGNISSLFNLNVGMNQEATGYENIVNLCLLKGFSKSQALSIIPDIEEFTELGKFLNAPVRTYSSGMQMKLVFSILTAFPPEILLIDEVIGVGDARFRQKSLDRLIKFADHCHLIVLATHSNEMIKEYCNKVVVLNKGEIVFSGEPQPAIDFYNQKFVVC